MAQMGRPRKEIDWDAVDKMAGIMCTQVEICDLIGVCEDTLNSRSKEKHGVTFSEYLRQKSQFGKRSLRRKQYEVAMSGDRTMLIWLGKQWLGQCDKVEQKTDITTKDEKLVIEFSSVKEK